MNLLNLVSCVECSIKILSILITVINFSCEYKPTETFLEYTFENKNSRFQMGQKTLRGNVLLPREFAQMKWK